jgi:hypothetical protein
MSKLSTTPHQTLAHWKDTRTEAKAKAAAELASTKRRALWRAAHLSAAAARATAGARYIGRACKHPGHGAERYVSGGGCVECARLRAERRRRERGAKVRRPLPQARHQLRSNRRADARRRRAVECGGKRPAAR